MVARHLLHVGLPRSACAIVTIVSVFMTKIPIKGDGAMVQWRMKVNTFQVHKAYRVVNVDLPRRPTPTLTNQIRYLGVLQQP